MLNPLVKDQLKKLASKNLCEFDEGTYVLEIKKSSAINNDPLKENECYLISVEDYILHPPEGFTLHTNWNNNIIPKHKVMKIDVCKVMGKMVKVNSIGYDLKNQVDINDVWSGWLPQKSITIIERL